MIMLKAYKQNSNLSIVVTSLENIIASSKDEFKVNDSISLDLVEKIISKENIQISRSYPFKITNETYANSNLIIKPIIVYGDVFGAIILFSDFDVTNYKNEILDSILYFCIHYIES
jgi:methyl coenzyme M reductase alpha subunit